MPFKQLPQDTSTMLFKLPHISNLFAFRDNFTNHHGMVLIVSEILKSGSLELIYFGPAEEKSFNYDEYLVDCENCAIVRVNILDTVLLNRSIEAARQSFVHELENRDSAITVDSTVYDQQKNVSTVDIVIAPDILAQAHSDHNEEAA